MEVNHYVYSGDYQRMVLIDLKSSYPNNWDEAKLRGHKVVIARTLEANAFAAYKPPTTKTLALLRLCVHPAFRRQGYGSALLEYIIRNERVSKITCVLRESNLAGCLFLSHHGFMSPSIMQGHFGDEDGIYFKKVL